MNNLRWLVKQDGTKTLQHKHGEWTPATADLWFDIPSIPEVKEDVKPREWAAVLYDEHHPDVCPLYGWGTKDKAISSGRVNDHKNPRIITVVEKIPNSVQITEMQLVNAWGNLDGMPGDFDKLLKQLGFDES